MQLRQRGRPSQYERGFTMRIYFKRIEANKWMAMHDKPNRRYFITIEPSDRRNGRLMVTVRQVHSHSASDEWILEPDYKNTDTAARAGLRIMDYWDEETEHAAKQASNVVPLQKA